MIKLPKQKNGANVKFSYELADQINKKAASSSLTIKLAKPNNATNSTLMIKLTKLNAGVGSSIHND